MLEYLGQCNTVYMQRALAESGNVKGRGRGEAHHLVYSQSPTGRPCLLRAAGPRPVWGWKKGRPVAGSIGWSAAYSAALRLASALSFAACSLHQHGNGLSALSVIHIAPQWVESHTFHIYSFATLYCLCFDGPISANFYTIM